MDESKNPFLQKNLHHHFSKSIDQEQTNKNIDAQRSIIAKIMRTMRWMEEVPPDIVHNISAFCFASPIVLVDSLYVL